MEHKDKIAYLRLILDSFGKIHNFTNEMSFVDFSNDNKTQSAIILQLQVVGELAKKTPDEIKLSIDIPWKQMAGFRDIVAHDYFGIDLMTVWNTVQKSVPDAETKIRKYLRF